ncbi:hypothetical protein Aduo_001383 [Ancylostoma duodenale]
MINITAQIDSKEGREHTEPEIQLWVGQSVTKTSVSMLWKPSSAGRGMRSPPDTLPSSSSTLDSPQLSVYSRDIISMDVISL